MKRFSFLVIVTRGIKGMGWDVVVVVVVVVV
jgi:hypothetical protein